MSWYHTYGRVANLPTTLPDGSLQQNRIPPSNTEQSTDGYTVASKWRTTGFTLSFPPPVLSVIGFVPGCSAHGRTSTHKAANSAACVGLVF